MLPRSSPLAIPLATGRRSRRHLRHAAGLATLGVVLFAVGAGRPPAPACGGPLAVGAEVRLRLDGPGRVCRTVTLPTGTALAAAVRQQGIDVTVSLLDPDGRELLRVDGPWRTTGSERLFAVARRAGEHRLVIQAAGRSVGIAILRTAALRPATAGDRLRARACRLGYQGDLLRQQAGGQALVRALREYSAAASLWQRIGDREALALARYRRGQVADDLELKARARDDFLAVLPVWRGRPEEIALLNRIALVADAQGRPEEALARYRQALRLALARRDVWGEAVTRSNLGEHWRLRGRYGDAATNLERALAAWRGLGEPATEATVEDLAGGLYLEMGQAQRAAAASRRALEIRQRAGIAGDDATSLYNLGLAQLERGAQVLALVALRRGLAESRAAADRRREAHFEIALGLLYLRREEADTAKAHLARALDMSRAAGDPWSEAICLANLADVALRSRRWVAAERLFVGARALYERLGDRNASASIHYGLALAQRGRGALAPAAANIERALAIVETLRSGPLGSDVRAGFLGARHRYYEAAVDIYMELDRRLPGAGHGARAFDLAEMGRARSLLDELSAERGGTGPGADRLVLAYPSGIERRIATTAAALQALPRNAAPALRRGRRAELDALLAERERLLGELRSRSRPREPGRPLTLARAQALLDPATVLVVYSLGEARSYVWVAGRRGVTWRELPPRAALETMARRAYQALSRPSPDPAARARALSALGAALLAPIAAEIRGKRLAIVADGALLYIPFGALPDPAAIAAGDPAAIDPAPLAAMHEVVSLPSVSVLGVLRRAAGERPPAPRTVAVLADPVFGWGDSRVGPGRRAPAADSPDRADALRSARDLGLRGLERLPSTADEARAILRLVPSGQGYAATGFAANLAAATDPRLRRYRILHFATHGLLNTANPQLSGLVLSLVDPAGRPRDGFLRSYQIYDLDLPVELVVLSACQTALGAEVRGEGLVGLPRGFLHAGARRVLVSLWQVEDAATAALMKRFYENLLRRRLPASAALRQAQEAMRREPRWREPYYWAGFVLQGDWK